MSSSLTVDDLRSALDDLGLSTRGHRSELRQRLKKGRARLASPSSGDDEAAAAAVTPPDAPAAARWSPQIDSFLVLDVEATCERGPRERPRAMSFEWPNEIIELPVVLLQWRCISSSSSSSSSVTPATTPRSPPTAPRSLSHLHSPSPQQRHAPRIPLGPRATSGSGGSPAGLASSSAAVDTRDAEAEQAGWELYVVDTFHTHVKPSWRPRLTRFCRELTGVDQATIDAAPPFPQAVNTLRAFLSRHSLLQAPTGPRGASTRTPASSPAKPKARTAFGTPIAPSSSTSVPSSPASSSAHAAPALRPGVAWVTHGMYDLGSFVVKQTWISGMEAVPAFLRGPLIDIRKGVTALIDIDRTPDPSPRKALPAAPPRATAGSTPPTGPAARRPPYRDTTIDGLLALLGLGAFEGRQHSGLADTQNIARLVIECARRVGLAATGAAETASSSSSSSASSGKEGETASSRERPTPSRAAQVAAARRAWKLERAALVPNTNLDRAAAKRWHWMGARAGVVNWTEAEERLTDVEDEEAVVGAIAAKVEGGQVGSDGDSTAQGEGVDIIGALFAKARMASAAGMNGQGGQGQGGDQRAAVDGGQGGAPQFKS